VDDLGAALVQVRQALRDLRRPPQRVRVRVHYLQCVGLGSGLGLRSGSMTGSRARVVLHALFPAMLADKLTQRPPRPITDQIR